MPHFDSFVLQDFIIIPAYKASPAGGLTKRDPVTEQPNIVLVKKFSSEAQLLVAYPIIHYILFTP